MKLSNLRTTLKYNTVAIMAILIAQGAVSMTQKEWVKVALGTPAQAAIAKQAAMPEVIDATNVPVPPAYPDTKLDKQGKEKIDWDKLTDGGY